MTKEKITDMLERAAWTFAQAFLGTFLLLISQVNDWTTLKATIGSVLAAALASGISALKTWVKETA